MSKAPYLRSYVEKYSKNGQEHFRFRDLEGHGKAEDTDLKFVSVTVRALFSIHMQAERIKRGAPNREVELANTPLGPRFAADVHRAGRDPDSKHDLAKCGGVGKSGKLPFHVKIKKDKQYLERLDTSWRPKDIALFHYPGEKKALNEGKQMSVAEAKEVLDYFASTYFVREYTEDRDRREEGYSVGPWEWDEGLELRYVHEQSRSREEILLVESVKKLHTSEGVEGLRDYFAEMLPNTPVRQEVVSELDQQVSERRVQEKGFVKETYEECLAVAERRNGRWSSALEEYKNLRVRMWSLIFGCTEDSAEERKRELERLEGRLVELQVPAASAAEVERCRDVIPVVEIPLLRGLRLMFRGGRGDFEDALRCFKDSIRAFRCEGDLDVHARGFGFHPVALAMAQRARVHAYLGDEPEANRWVGKALDFASKVSDKKTTGLVDVICVHVLSIFESTRDQAQSLLNKRREYLRREPFLRSRAEAMELFLRSARGECSVEEIDNYFAVPEDTSDTYATQTIPSGLVTYGPVASTCWLTMCAESYLNCGAAGSAQALAEKAIKYSEESGEGFFVAPAYIVAGKASRALGHDGAARRMFEMAMEIAEGQPAHLFRHWAERELQGPGEGLATPTA